MAKRKATVFRGAQTHHDGLSPSHVCGGLPIQQRLSQTLLIRALNKQDIQRRLKRLVGTYTLDDKEGVDVGICYSHLMQNSPFTIQTPFLFRTQFGQAKRDCFDDPTARVPGDD
jgi:hypothetical protein